MESDARELCCSDGVFKDMLLRVTEKLIQSVAETVMADRYTHIPSAPTSTATEPCSTTARGAAIDMIIKTGITHSIAMLVNGDDGLPCNPLGDTSGDSSGHRCNCIMAKGFDHSPGVVTCTGISLPIAHDGSLSRESAARSETWEACIGAAIEEGIHMSRASTGTVMLHKDEAGRISTDGMMYIGGSGTDTRNTIADVHHARLGKHASVLPTSLATPDHLFHISLSFSNIIKHVAKGFSNGKLDSIDVACSIV